MFCKGAGFRAASVGVFIESEDSGLELFTSDLSGMVGVDTLSIPGSRAFQFSVAVLGPRLMIGLTVLVPPLMLRATLEP